MQFWPGILGYVKMILKNMKACQMPEPTLQIMEELKPSQVWACALYL